MPEADVLVADDDSPDGTGDVADELAAADEQVHVLHRTGKAGLGAAYMAGFRWALADGYDVVVEMDADGSHAPEELPRLLTALRDADLVIGSRWVPGGQMLNWPLYRQLISIGGVDVRAGAAAVPGARRDRRLPGVPPAGAGGAQARRGRLAGLLLPDRPGLETWRSGFRVREVPITFAERELGRSKMSRAIVLEALWRVASWGLTSRSRGARARALAARH